MNFLTFWEYDLSKVKTREHLPEAIVSVSSATCLFCPFLFICISMYANAVESSLVERYLGEYVHSDSRSISFRTPLMRTLKRKRL